MRSAATQKSQNSTTNMSAINSQAKKYGIKAPSKLIWRRWIVSEEYTRNLTIVNTMPFTMRITYRPPEKLKKITYRRTGSGDRDRGQGTSSQSAHNETIQSSVFSTLYPKPILLAAGNNFTLPVSFLPIGYMKFEDDIEFTVEPCINPGPEDDFTENAYQQHKINKNQKSWDYYRLPKKFKFSVELKAVLPEAKLKVPKRINIDPCAVLDCGIATFPVSNPSEDTGVIVNFEVSSPFSIENEEITLPPKKSQMVKIKFEPNRAGNFRANIKCHYRDSEESVSCSSASGNDATSISSARSGSIKNILTKRIHVTSCSKYPHLQCTNSLDFSKVPFGKIKTKSITVKNCCDVPTSVEIIPVILDEWQKSYMPFQIENSKFILAGAGDKNGNDSKSISINYSPQNAEAETVRFFKIIACGSLSCHKLKCTGMIEKPNVVSMINLREEESCLNFGETEVGHEYKLRLTLCNQSDAEAYYTLSGLETPSGKTGNVFTVYHDPSEKNYNSKKSQPLKETNDGYIPGASGALSGNSQRRLLISFKPQFPIAYYRKVALLVHQQEPQFITLMGTARSQTSIPAILEDYHLENYKLNEYKGIEGFPPSILQAKIENGEIVENVNKPGLLSLPGENAQMSRNPSTPYNSTFDEFFDDGTIDDISYKPPELQFDQTCVDFGKCETNKTYSHTVCLSNNTHGTVSVFWSKSDHFKIEPNTTEIMPKSAARFRIICKYSTQDKFFGQNLECYGCYTEQLDYRKVKKNLIQPTWCAVLTATANTFISNPYSATIRFSDKVITVPAFSPGRASYGTFILENHDLSTPVLYNLGEDEHSKIGASMANCKPVNALVTTSYEVVAIRLKSSDPRSSGPKSLVNALEFERTNIVNQLESSEEQASKKENSKISPSKESLKNGSSKAVTVEDDSKIIKSAENLLEDLQEPLPTTNTATKNSTTAINSELKFNFNASNQSHTLQVQGFSATPVVNFPNKIFFRPTCVDTSSERTETIQNNSPLAINYTWVTIDGTTGNDSANEQNSALDIQPRMGTIKPGDCNEFKVIFSPKKAGNYEIKVKLFINTDNTSMNNKSMFLTCFGMAAIGQLSVPNRRLNLGSVIVDRPIEFTLPLLNKVECDIPWRIWMKEESNKDCVINVSPMTGVLPAKAKTNVHISIIPRYQGQMKFNCISSCATNIHESVSSLHRLKKKMISQSAQNLGGLGKFCMTYSSFKFLFQIFVQAQKNFWPIIVPASIHLSPIENISSQHLEKWLNVQKFNQTFLQKRGNSIAPNTEEELIDLPSDIDMTLGASPINSTSNMLINIELKNTSSVVANLKILQPKDLRIKTPHWASPDIMPNGDKMKLLKVEESMMFKFSCNKAELQPGESVTVTISYDPRKIPGKNTQRFLLTLDGGPSLIVDMHGYSVPEKEPFVLIMPTYALDDTTISQPEQNLTQYLPLYNGSTKSVNYQIEVSDETAEEFGVNILNCLSPEGVIQPGKFANVPFAFKPLENREYAMEVYLTVDGLEKSQLITLLGRGVQTSTAGGKYNISAVSGTCNNGNSTAPGCSLFTKPLTNYSKPPKLSMQLSESLVNFGKVPLYARKTKIIFLQNTSSTDNILYSFQEAGHTDIFKLTPSHGRLSPNEYATITIIYTALPPEKVFYDEIVCSVVLEKDSLEYDRKMAEFKEMKKRADFEFTIDDVIKAENENEQNEFKKSPMRPHKPSGSMYESLKEAPNNTTFTRNDTLPSINSRASRYRKPTKPISAASASGDAYNQKLPTKPSTLFLHVTLTGESERSSNINSGMTYFNIANSKNTHTSEKRVSDSNIYEGEPEIMEDLCGDLIHDILYGSDIMNKIEILDNVEPPRYGQLTDKKLGNCVERENTEPNLFKTILSQDKKIISEKAIPDISALKMATELIEETVKNIISQAVQEDFQITSPYMFITRKGSGKKRD